MERFLLTDEERERFAAYCRRYAETCRLIGEQFEKAQLPQPVVQTLKNKELAKAEAYQFVADHLAGTSVWETGKP